VKFAWFVRVLMAVVLFAGLVSLGSPKISFSSPILSQIKSVWYLGWDKNTYAGTNTALELAELKRRLNINTVGLIVPLFQESQRATNPHRDPTRTPSDAQLRRVIDQAHARGLQVILLPYLLSDDGHWVGTLAPTNVAQWFRRWRTLLNQYAELAQATKTEILLIGWELETLLPEIEEWKKAIAEVRERFGGLLSYTTNFWADPDEYQRVLDWSPWEQLDFVGLSAYFELSRKEDPTVEELRQAWHADVHGQDLISDMAQLSETFGRCMVLWELGYESKAGTTQRPWDFLTPGPESEAEQSNAFLAAFQELGNESWLAGYSVWSQGMGLTKTSTGYDILGKLAELTVRTHELPTRSCEDAR
jgi:hypothetical protein